MSQWGFITFSRLLTDVGVLPYAGSHHPPVLLQACNQHKCLTECGKLSTCENSLHGEEENPRQQFDSHWGRLLRNKRDTYFRDTIRIQFILSFDFLLIPLSSTNHRIRLHKRKFNKLVQYKLKSKFFLKMIYCWISLLSIKCTFILIPSASIQNSKVSNQSS